jgi:hypothetical protein
MAWTAPRTWVALEVPTSSIMNTYIRDNQLDLDARTTVQQASVATDQSRSNTTLGDLATIGPSITLVTGTLVTIVLSATMYNDTANKSCNMSFAISGATTAAAALLRAIRYKCINAADVESFSRVFTLSVTPGSNTFTAKYSSDAASTAHFLDRQIIGWPANKLS